MEDWIAPDPKIVIVRLQKREGLIRARSAGAEVATGDVIVFLDSHCECNVGWLEPMLGRIHQDRKIVVCPVIDNISWKTLDYSWGQGDVGNRGGFNWGLIFKWRKIPKYEQERRAGDPTRCVCVIRNIVLQCHFILNMEGSYAFIDLYMMHFKRVVD